MKAISRRPIPEYKEGTLDMVLSLELIDVVPLMPGLELRQTVGTR